MTKISYVDLSTQWEDERAELLPIIEEALAKGNYVGGYVAGEQVEQFEHAVAKVCDARFAVALNSGTDALICALRALEIGSGDEIITPPNSFVASTSAIVQVGATPVFVDVLPDQNIDPSLIESAITSRTRAIMPVHLTGRMAEMQEISALAKKYDLHVIEDAAQAIGALYEGQPSGSIGEIGCFSTHPLKNLNACGDGGFVTTSDSELAEKITLMRNHGLTNRNTVERFGIVSRMDVVQAVILSYRLSRISGVIENRRHNASIYRAELDTDYVFIPDENEHMFDTYHTFVIQGERRDELRSYLMSNGIETAIHYPIPIHLQAAAQFLGYKQGDFSVCERQAERILTLPIHQYMSEKEVSYVASCVNEFFVATN